MTTCTAQNTITAGDIDGLNKDIDTISEVVESTDLTAETKNGRTIDTLTGRLLKLGYMVPVPYEAGIVFSETDSTKTIERDGIIYAPYPSELPFTTSGTWLGDDADKFYPIQGQLYANTVSDLRAITPGSATYIEVLGHTGVGDGGGGGFYIVTGEAPGTFTDDNGMTIVPNGGDGSAAYLRLTDTYRMEMYGGRNDGTGAAATCTAIEALANYLSAAFDGGVIDLTGATIAINRTVVIPPYVSLVGTTESTTIVPEAGTYNDGFCFYMNTVDGITPVAEYGIKNIGRFHGIEIDNRDNDIPNCRGILFHGGYLFQETRWTNMSQGLARLTDYYSDWISIRDFQYRQSQDLTTYYACDIRGLGDGLDVDRCDFVRESEANDSPNGIRLDGCRGGRLVNVINGHHHFARVTALNFGSGHLERGTITLDGCDATIHDSMIYHALDSGPKIIMDQTLYFGNAFSVNLQSCRFAMTNNDSQVITADIKWDPSVTLYIKDCTRVPYWSYRTEVEEDGNRFNQTGVYVVDDNDAPIDAFNDYSYAGSVSGVISKQRQAGINSPYVMISCDAKCGEATPEGLDAVITVGSPSWQIANGTYYYTAQMVWDPVRLIGQVTSDELSQTTAGEGIRLQFNFGARPHRFIARIYRGTSPGSYDAYCDVPMYDTIRIVDNGLNLGGFPWVSRTAGAVTAMTGSARMLELKSGTAKFYREGSAQPTLGTWVRGDEVVQINPSVNVNNQIIRGFIRLTSGSGHVDGTDWVKLYVSTVSPAT